jgi:diaminohydroxyphosphoribosylaminopyrimidine deaminase/5-amino-6-(5-phosphoribosylamino)uracil reductase
MVVYSKLMRKCLTLAQNGFGKTRSNPLVGSIIERDGQILGEGYHQAYGQPHAEVMAINSLPPGIDLKDACLYVNLEPCSHYGKTPPCADFVIKSGIKKIVIGAIDPNPKVSGAGLKKLLDAGCQVTQAVLEDECKFLNRRFYTFHQKNRPWIILKWAQSSDGFISKEPAQKTQISCIESQQLLHSWRSAEMAILVGTNTARIDNPLLTARQPQAINPIRIVLDRNLSLPKNLQIFNQESQTIIFTEKSVPKYSENVEIVSLEFDENLEENICKHLWRLNINSCIIEGGAHTLNKWIQKGLYDEARVIISPMIIGEGLKAPYINLAHTAPIKIGSDSLYILENSEFRRTNAVTPSFY